LGVCFSSKNARGSKEAVKPLEHTYRSAEKVKQELRKRGLPVDRIFNSVIGQLVPPSKWDQADDAGGLRKKTAR
jgi:hypothetical protein